MMIMTAGFLTPEDVALRGYQGLLSQPFEREAIVELVKQGLAAKRANDAQERAAHERPSSGEEDDGTNWPLSPLLKVRAAYLPAAHLWCWQPTWVNGHELAAWEQKAGLHAFVTARRRLGLTPDHPGDHGHRHPETRPGSGATHTAAHQA